MPLYKSSDGLITRQSLLLILKADLRSSLVCKLFVVCCLSVYIFEVNPYFMRIIRWQACCGLLVFLKTAIALEQDKLIATEPPLTILQQLTQVGDNNLGLNNPRRATVSDDGKYVFIVSGDDNALTIFDVGQTNFLQHKQVFKNTDDVNYRLEGASDVLSFLNGRLIVTSSFYDGALSIFKRAQNHQYQFSYSMSDKLSYDRVFKDPTPLGSLDKHGLLGAWELTKLNESQFVVASYQSNTVRFFDVQADKVVSNDKLNASLHNYDFGKPVAVERRRNQHGDEKLLVAGFEASILTVLEKDQVGEYQVMQTLPLKKLGCLNPQALYNRDDMYVYIACSGSNKVLILGENKTGKLESLFALEHDRLKGVSDIIFHPERPVGYAVSEQSDGIIVLNILENGGLSVIQTDQEQQVLSHISSLSWLSHNILLVTSGKKDSVFVVKVTRE